MLDAALHAPQAGFGEEDFYPALEQKAAVLAVRIARNHPLPDGNKRLAWRSLTIFLALNDRTLVAGVDDAVAFMLGVAAGLIATNECRTPPQALAGCRKTSFPCHSMKSAAGGG